MGLCVWTAVHLNVDPDANPTRTFRRKLLWVFIGLFCPEIVLASSYEQWQKSHELHQRIEDRDCTAEDSFGQEKEEDEAPLSARGRMWRSLIKRWRKSRQERAFSMTCSFFIVMGGVTIAKEDYENKNRNQYTLTPEGFEYLLDLGILESSCVDTATILDKGKADFLAKFLVCVQAAWMVLQCILRKLKGLPVTLIELNVLLHVIIALAMYWFWWKKPLNIGKAIQVYKSPDLACILVAAEMRRQQGIIVRLMGENEDETLPDFEPKQLQRESETLYIRYTALNPFVDLAKFANHFKIAGAPPEDWKAHGNRKWALWDLVRAQRRNKDRKDVIMLLPTQSIKEPANDQNEMSTGDRCLGDEKDEIRIEASEKKTRALIQGNPHKTVTITEIEIQILFAAAKALSNPKNAKLKEDYDAFSHERGYLWNQHQDEELRTHRIKNLYFDMDIVLNDIDGLKDPHILLSLLNIMYGGAHASAWNGHFPTQLEMWLWRVSCLTLSLPAIVTTAKLITQKLPKKWHVDYYVHIAVHVLLHPVLLVYFCARIYVVVESFISIRNLPEGAYETVSISEYWPHF
ncbi:hypothetical protein BDD12DRAFT_895439 [Trichophaea hybrida]|nr:hypothetical protein BDD12DRAFT_895439 [Trichophaea hybrida]